MVSAPGVSQLQPLREEALEFVVMLRDDVFDPNNAAGLLPEDDEVDYLIPLRLHHSAGARRSDTLTCLWALERSGDRLVDAATPVGYDKIIELARIDPVTGDLLRMFRGKIGEQSHYFDANRESVYVHAQYDAWLIGPYKTAGYWVRMPDDTRQFVDGRRLVFNPEIDDEVKPNREGRGDDKNEDPALDADLVYWWTDWTSTLTGPARTYAGYLGHLWTLPHVVQTLCWMLNPDEEWIENPRLDELQTALAIEDVVPEDVVRNLTVSLNRWLPEALDDVLTPYGFSWKIEFGAEPGDKDRLAFFARNTGVKVDVFGVRPGEFIDRNNNNISSYHANWSLSELANVFEGRTANLQIESTFELMPGWTDEPLGVEDDGTLNLAKLNAAARNNDDLCRKFVLNEAADYVGAWNRVAPTDLDSLLTEPHPTWGDSTDPDGTGPLGPTYARTTTVRRRRFLPALTLGLDRHPIGADGFELQVRKQSYDQDTAETTIVWETVDWPFDVLADEAGIQLTGALRQDVYQALQDEPDEPPLRITATLESDFARWVILPKRDESPRGDQVRVVLDLSERFHVRTVDTTSRWYDNRHADLTDLSTDSSLGTDRSVLTLITEDGYLPEILRTGDRITIAGSTGNNGRYTLASCVDGTLDDEYVLTLDELLPDATVDGVVGWLTEEIDDTMRMTEFLEHLQAIDDTAEVSCSITLDGVAHQEYQVGKMLGKVVGRELDLNAATPGTTEKRLQIIGYNLEFENGQQMELLLETTRVERFDFGREA